MNDAEKLIYLQTIIQVISEMPIIKRAFGYSDIIDIYPA